MPFDPSPASGRILPVHAHARAVAFWLLGVAGLVWIMVAIGGATRLTGSGLSIMEWAPISGILPPLSEAEWQRLYDLYRTIPQYELVNAGFGMEGFRRIFWLEWLHRAWGRLIGLAYVGGLVWFWAKGMIPAGYKPWLVLLLVLGGLQGVLGWFMVASGFEAGRTEVSPYRLVMHLGLALVLFSMLLWTALGLLRPERVAPAGARSVRPWLHAAAALAFATMLAGGFVAGIRAGFTFNTFPLMDGAWVPAGYLDLTPWWRNLTANIAAVQWNHRLLATLCLAAALAAAAVAWRRLPGGLARGAVLVFALTVVAQYGLGILTLVHVVPVGLGTLHQTAAVAVLASALVALHALGRRAA